MDFNNDFIESLGVGSSISGLSSSQEVSLRVELQLKPVYYKLIPLLKTLNDLIPSGETVVDEMDLRSRDNLKFTLWELEGLMLLVDTLQLDIRSKIVKIGDYQRTEDKLRG